jgi:homoserine kinase
MNDETRDHPGLLGVAVSGAGSTMIAFATENFSQIAAEIKQRFASAGVKSRAIEADVDNRGRVVGSAREG